MKYLILILFLIGCSTNNDFKTTCVDGRLWEKGLEVIHSSDEDLVGSFLDLPIQGFYGRHYVAEIVSCEHRWCIYSIEPIQNHPSGWLNGCYSTQ